MDDIDRRPGGLADRHCPLDGGPLGQHRPAGRPVGQTAAPGRKQLLASESDQRAVLTVDQRQHPELPGTPDGLDHLGGARLELTGGHEQLQARVPGGRQQRQLGQGAGRRFGHDRMQHIVNGSGVLGGSQVAGDGVAERLISRGKSHVADRGDAAGDGGSRAAGEVVHPVGDTRLRRLRR